MVPDSEFGAEEAVAGVADPQPGVCTTGGDAPSSSERVK